MSEWTSVLAVFWALWALDGLRLGPRRIFTFVGRLRSRRTRGEHATADVSAARIAYSRLSVPGILPTSWRMATADVPLCLSPHGLCNRVVGAAGRPAETSADMQAWRWEDVREVGVAKGWIYINGARFCPDTQHVRPAELLVLARLPVDAREKRIRMLMNAWFRPTHLRRRARALQRRTAWVAALNSVVLAALVGIAAYVTFDVASRLPDRWSARFADALPWLLLALVALHLSGVVLAWRAVRRLKAMRSEKRGSTLFSALLLPPQALRLRAVLADGFFPAQHPLAAVVAFARPRERAPWAFHALADLRWPIAAEDSAATQEIIAWFRPELETRLLAVGDFRADTLLAAPQPDAATSCSYCPRCRDQFVGKVGVCPHGIPLQPFRPETAACVGGGKPVSAAR